MIFTLEPSIASLLLFDGANIAFEHAIERDKFEVEFEGLDYSNIRQLSYEPENKYFHLIDASGKLNVFDSADDDANFSLVQSSWNNLVNLFQQHQRVESEANLENNSPV